MALTASARQAYGLVNPYVPWSRRAWRNTAFVAAGVPVHPVVLAFVLLSWRFFLPLSKPAFGLVLVVSLALSLTATAPLTAVQRHRFWALLGDDIPRVREERRDLAGLLRSPIRWRRLAYHALAGPCLAAGGLCVIFMWAAGFALALLEAYAWALPYGSPLSQSGHAVRDGVLTAVGAALLPAAPAAAEVVTRADRYAAHALLGPSRAERLERRVEDLAESRAGVVDAADAERRRIERDLHDGVQPRLVALAMSLGLARATLTGVPDEAIRVIAEAHEEAKEALTELRGVVRGLHPAVLDDRGLDAALSGIAARAPMPVRLRVDVPERPSPTVEAVAYFVASESLTNAARHARASRVEIVAERRGDVLVMTITDDGAGGADPARGTGLTGLRQRVASVDGTFLISSPAGGPTVVAVELPCVS